jgi:hypothetical protein
MKIEQTKIRSLLNRLAVFILVAGWSAAVLVYLNGADDSGNVVGYETVDGQRFEIRAEDSRRYTNDLERIGGRTAVMAAAIDTWLGGLLHGKRLAFSLALVSLGGAFLCWWIADHPDYRQPQAASDERDDAGDESRG